MMLKNDVLTAISKLYVVFSSEHYYFNQGKDSKCIKITHLSNYHEKHGFTVLCLNDFMVGRSRHKFILALYLHVLDHFVSCSLKWGPIFSKILNGHRPRLGAPTSAGGGGGTDLGFNISDSIHPSNIIECNSYKYSFLLFLKQINFTNCNKTTDTHINDKNALLSKTGRLGLQTQVTTRLSSVSSCWQNVSITFS